MSYTRISRLLEILTLVQARKGLNAETLADLCGVDKRTIYRDLVALADAGVPVVSDSATSGYTVERNFFLPPVHLSMDEALALAVLCEDLAESGQIPCLRAAIRALTKVRSQLPENIREDLDRLSQHIAIRTSNAEGDDGTTDVFEQVQRAIASGTALRCRYESSSNPSADEAFVFNPYALFFSVRAWYAAGFHHGRDEIRNLKLSRFVSIEATTQPFEIPKDFSVDGHLGHAWRMIRGDQTHEIEIVFDPDFADNIAETTWHRTQQVEYMDDGSVIFRCRVDGLDEIVWWVLSMGPKCRVVKPAALADRVRELAQQTAAVYRGGSES
ncbi:MAG: helix-turn-helix transcriptional regulator [Phycisphaerales bacterium]